MNGVPPESILMPGRFNQGHSENWMRAIPMYLLPAVSGGRSTSSHKGKAFAVVFVERAAPQDDIGWAILRFRSSPATFRDQFFSGGNKSSLHFRAHLRIISPS
jgi:hypothetical protein